MLPRSSAAALCRIRPACSLAQLDRITTATWSSFYQEALNHRRTTPTGALRSTRERLQEINIPAFNVGGWSTIMSKRLATFAKLSKRSGAHRVMIGPWRHGMEPLTRLRSESRVNVRAIQAQWFDHWMRGPNPFRTTRPRQCAFS
jgi:predicted acyl esterase